MVENPYQSPLPIATAVDESSAPVSGDLFYVDGKYIIARSGDMLLPICVKTGRPVGADEMVTKRFVWAPSWVGLLFLLSPLVLLIVYLAVRKNCKLTYGLSREIKARYRNRIVIKAAVCIGSFAAMFASFAGKPSQWGLIWLVVFLVSLIACAYGNSPLTVSKHENGEFWFTGASREFLAAVQSYSPPA